MFDQKYKYDIQEIQNELLVFLDNENNMEEHFENFRTLINNSKIQENSDDLYLILKLISKIAKNHHRKTDFFDKIEKIILFLKEGIINNFSKDKIFNIFQANKAILLFLFEEKILSFDESIFDLLTSKLKYKSSGLIMFFSPEIKPFESIFKQMIEDEIANEVEKLNKEKDDKLNEKDNSIESCEWDSIDEEDFINNENFDFFSYLDFGDLSNNSNQNNSTKTTTAFSDRNESDKPTKATTAFSDRNESDKPTKTTTAFSDRNESDKPTKATTAFSDRNESDKPTKTTTAFSDRNESDKPTKTTTAFSDRNESDKPTKATTAFSDRNEPKKYPKTTTAFSDRNESKKYPKTTKAFSDRNEPKKYSKTTTAFSDQRKAYHLMEKKEMGYLDIINRRIESEIIRTEIVKIFNKKIPTDFYKKRKTFENENNICHLIRNDSVDDFIIFVNKNDYSLNSKIEPSIFETNSFLISPKPTLIEYSSFYGSVQIFKFLLLNGANHDSKLWLYSIHGNRPEIIHILEKESIKPNYQECIIEAIKCHHNDIANYLKNKIIDKNERQIIDDSIIKSAFRYYNFAFISDDIDRKYIDVAFKYKYYKIVGNLLKTKGINRKGQSMKVILQWSIENDKTEMITDALQSFQKITSDLFSRNKKLTKIAFPNSVTVIDRESFSECSSLQEVIIPSSVTCIEENSFQDCTSLTKVHFEGMDISFGYHVFDGVISLELTGNLEHIPMHLFESNDSLIELKISLTITEICERCFRECQKIRKIVLPSSLSSIGEEAFSNCQLLEEILIPPNVSSIEKRAFLNCKSLRNLPLRLPITEINERTFYGTGLESCIIPQYVDQIRDEAFKHCSKLSLISIPSSVELFGYSIFEGVVSLEIFGDIKFIPVNLFQYNTTLKELIIEASVSDIEKGSFEGCSSLTRIVLPQSLKAIKDYTFRYCASLNDISLPRSMEKIGEESFAGCSSLQHIELPPSITNIGKNAFKECPNSLSL